MQIFKTTEEAEDYFANGLRLVTTAKDFFKDLDRAFKNWSEGVIVEDWEKDSYDLSEAMKGLY
jgi:hypothetical protein